MRMLSKYLQVVSFSTFSSLIFDFFKSWRLPGNATRHSFYQDGTSQNTSREIEKKQAEKTKRTYLISTAPAASVGKTAPRTCVHTSISVHRKKAYLNMIWSETQNVSIGDVDRCSVWNLWILLKNIDKYLSLQNRLSKEEAKILSSRSRKTICH